MPRPDPSRGVLTVNLEEGMPICDVAIRRLTAQLHQAKQLGTPVLKIIHGYGSSGTGGRIRVEARRYLARCVQQGLVEQFIPGEEFTIFNAGTQAALRKYPVLSGDRDLERSNNGVTIVIVRMDPRQK